LIIEKGQPVKKGIFLIAFISICSCSFGQDSTVVKPKKAVPRYSTHFDEGEATPESSEIVTEDGEVTLSGKILNSRTHMPVNARVDIFRNSDFISIKEESAENGEFKTHLSDYGFYLISISAPGYMSTNDTLWVLNEKRKVIDKSFSIVPMQVGYTLRLSDVHFEFGKAELSTTSYPELDKTVSFLKENHGTRFEISGHTDHSGPPDTNLRLSEERARAVVNYLTSHGADPSQLIARGYGDTAPITTHGAEAINRRVELTVLDVGEQAGEK
jgi:OOP family OmpA-OmpF porin